MMSAYRDMFYNLTERHAYHAVATVTIVTTPVLITVMDHSVLQDTKSMLSLDVINVIHIALVVKCKELQNVMVKPIVVKDTITTRAFIPVQLVLLTVILVLPMEQENATTVAVLNIIMLNLTTALACSVH